MTSRYNPWFYYEDWQGDPFVHISLPLPVSYGPGMITRDFVDTDEFRIWLKDTYGMIGRQLNDR